MPFATLASSWLALTPPLVLDAWKPVPCKFGRTSTSHNTAEKLWTKGCLALSHTNAHTAKKVLDWSSMQMHHHLWNKWGEHCHLNYSPPATVVGSTVYRVAHSPQRDEGNLPTIYLTTEIYPSLASVRISLLHICNIIFKLWEWMNAKKTRFLAHCSCHYIFPHAHSWITLEVWRILVG